MAAELLYTSLLMILKICKTRFELTLHTCGTAQELQHLAALDEANSNQYPSFQPYMSNGCGGRSNSSLEITT